MTGARDEDALQQSNYLKGVTSPADPASDSARSEGREGDRARQRSSSVQDASYKQKGTITPSSSRPNLLAISAALGKSNATSSTSTTTVPRVQRSFSSRSITAGRDSPSHSSIDDSASDLTSSAIKPRPFVTLSLPASPLAAKHAKATTARGSDAVEDNEDDASTKDPASEDAASRAVSVEAPLSPQEDVAVLSADAEQRDDNDSVSEYNAEAELVAWPTQDQLDPRVVLREQLRRSESARANVRAGRTRADSYRSSKSATTSLRSALTANPWADQPSEYLEVSGKVTVLPQPAHSPKASSHPRRYFVLTSAGKPVFASDSNWRKRRQVPDSTATIEEAREEDSEEMLTSLVGVIQAIISLYAVENDMIRYIDAGDLRIAFYLKAPIYLVAVSDWCEPESLLRTQLDYLYLSIISVTTQASIASIFKQRSNFDLRRLLAGTDNILNGVLTGLQETSLQVDRLLEAVSGALKVVPFLADLNHSLQTSGSNSSIATEYNVEGLRDECTKALRPAKAQEGMLYALLVSNSSLITLVRPKDHSIHPADLHILLSTIDSTDALRQPNSESWIPICLPRFNSRGFLHAFISYFDSEAGADEEGRDSVNAQQERDLSLGVILVTADKEGFFSMKTWKDDIVAQLLRKPTRLSSTISATPQHSLYNRLVKAVVPVNITPLPPTENGGHQAHLPDGKTRLTAHQQPEIQPIKHFWYKSKTHVQIFTPFCTSEGVGTHSATSFTGVYANSSERRRTLVGMYLHAREALHNTAGRSRGDGPSKLVYLVGQEEAVLAMSTSTYELFVCLPTHATKRVATDAAQALARWIRKNERRIFLTNSSSF
ncbi:DUF254-domain-containing protein [Cystobasidium minutum MCA 4210]|uniref:DUF254-domain-containing protein n=1 Tax=Cystobasidium minutum MCA 4210 TaxID=1397322 RepID=UPI0034CF802C|eukprot:jgi/Rhomi1/174507/fgenesh1_kg.8_\